MSSGNTNRANLPAAILVFAFLMIWQMAALGMDAAYILPSPIQVVQKLWDLRGPLFTAHLPATMQVVAIGLIISIVLGMALAILMDASPVAEKALYPLVIASQTIPTTALAPLFVLWFGYTIWSKVLVTVLITFFPITITVFDGFRSVRTEMKDDMQKSIANYYGVKELFPYSTTVFCYDKNHVGMYFRLMLTAKGKCHENEYLQRLFEAVKYMDTQKYKYDDKKNNALRQQRWARMKSK